MTASPIIYLLAAAATPQPVSPDIAQMLRDEIAPYLQCMRTYDARRAALWQSDNDLIAQMEKAIADNTGTEDMNRDFVEKLSQNHAELFTLEQAAERMCERDRYQAKLDAALLRLRPGDKASNVSEFGLRVLQWFEIIDRDLALFVKLKAPPRSFLPSFFTQIKPPIRIEAKSDAKNK
jgi:hypothetical protein